MSFNCVPPGNVELSPVASYQNGVMPEVQLASLKKLERQALVSGAVDASVVPFQYLQKAFEVINTPAEAGMARASPKSKQIPVKVARIVLIIEGSVSQTESTHALVVAGCPLQCPNQGMGARGVTTDETVRRMGR